MNLSSVPVDELDQYGSAGAEERHRRDERKREQESRQQEAQNKREARQWMRSACNECLNLLVDDSRLDNFGRSDKLKTADTVKNCCGGPVFESHTETAEELKQRANQELTRRKREMAQQVKAQQSGEIVPGVSDRQLAMVAGGVVALWVVSRSMGSSSSSSSGGSSRRSFGTTTELTPDDDGNVECPECGAEKSARGVFGHMRFSDDHPDPEEIGLEIDDA